MTTLKTEFGLATRRLNSTTSWLFLLVVVVVAAVTRLIAFDTAYDVYVDEFLYAFLSESVRMAGLPPTSGDGNFFIHPPGFFLWGTWWQMVAGRGQDPFEQVYLLRAAQIILSLITAAAVFAIARRLAGPWAGLAAGLLFAIDPFVLRQNGRILLETAVMAPVLVGYWLLLKHVDTGARSRWAPITVGLLFGWAVFTKDMALFCTIIPMLFLLVGGWVIPRVQSLVIIASAAVPYSLYLGMVLANGMFSDWFGSKADGLSRLLGTTVPTGYNSEAGPDLSTVVASKLGEFGTSFTVLALGGLAALWLLARGTRGDRLLSLFAVSAEGTVVYGMLFGTSEEHLYYYAMIPAILCLVVLVARVIQESRERGSLIPQAITGLALVCVLVAAFDVSAWIRTRSAPDDAQLTAARWIEANVAPGATISYVVSQTAASLADQEYELVRLGARSEMADHNPLYIVVLEKEVEEGYSGVTEGRLEFFTDRADLVFSDSGATYNTVSVYRAWSSSRW